MRNEIKKLIYEYNNGNIREIVDKYLNGQINFEKLCSKLNMPYDLVYDLIIIIGGKDAIE